MFWPIKLGPISQNSKRNYQEENKIFQFSFYIDSLNLNFRAKQLMDSAVYSIYVQGVAMPFNASYMANIAILMMKNDVKLIKYFTSLAWLHCWQKKGQNRLQVLDTSYQPQGLTKKM